MADGGRSSAELSSEASRSPFFGFKPRCDVHDASLVFSKPTLFNIRLMNDAARRAAFVSWFNDSPCKGDREALIRKSGLTKGRVSQLFDPGQRFGEQAAENLAQRLGLSLDVFSNQASEVSNVIPATTGATMIPLISNVQAGAWSETVDPHQAGDASKWLMTDAPVSRSSFALQVQGDSMTPDFQPGDRIIVDPAVQPRLGDFVVAKNGNQEATFRKYRPRGVDAGGQTVFELVALNEDYPSMRSDMTPMRIIGTMVEHRKYRRR